MYGPTSIFNFNSLVGRYQFKAFFRKSSERSFSSSINQIKAFPDSGILRWTSMKTFNTAHTSYSRIHTAKLHLLQNSKFLKLWLDLCLFIVIYQVYYQSEFVRVPVYVAFRKLEFLESLISISCRDFLYEKLQRLFDEKLQRFQVCWRSILTCYRSYQRSLYCVVTCENYCNMGSLKRYVTRHFRIVLLPCSRK